MPSGAPFTRPLRLIRHAACSGLPLYPYVQLLFDLIDQAIPNSENKVLFLGPQGHSTGIVRGIDSTVYGPVYRRLALLSPRESRFLPLRVLASLGKDVFEHDERVLPGFRKGQSYAELFAPLGFDLSLGCILRHEGEVTGFYPLWRDRTAPAFSAAERKFLSRAAPWIAHGVATGLRRRACGVPEDGPFDPLPNLAHGMLLLDRNGRILGLNERARALFMRLDEYDASSTGTFFSLWRDTVGAAQRIAAILRDIISIKTRDDAHVPAVHMLTHPSGLCLRLHGWWLEGESHRTLISVLVEEVMPRSVKIDCVRLRYGLSARETEIMQAIAQGEGPANTATRMALSTHTVRTLRERLSTKIGLTSPAAIRELLDAYPASPRHDG